MISFEFPVTERVRLLLRLEDLFARLDHHLSAGAALDHHAALLTLFDLAELGGRVDIKGELLQELERQKQLLDTLRDNPAISETALDAWLAEIDQAQRLLLRQSNRLGHSIRENEWLSSIRQRAMLAGGVSRFELPAYHSWLSLPDEARAADLAGWIAPVLPAREGTRILLELLRRSGKTFELVARGGQFQQMSGGRSVHLLRVTLEAGTDAVPELSANKYAINVRFIQARPRRGRALPVTADIPFTLTHCRF